MPETGFKYLAEALLLTMSLCNAAGILLLKSVAGAPGKLKEKIYRPRFVAGVFLLAMSPVFLFLAADLCTFTRLYAFSALSYIFILLLSWLFLKEKLDASKIIGSVLIIAGILYLKK